MINMKEQILQEKYSDLVLQMGVNLQKDQALVINGPVKGAAFVRLVAHKAYELDAQEMLQNWEDDEQSLLKYQRATEEVIENFADWKVQLQETYAKDGAAFLSIHATDPDLLQDVDSSRVAKASKAAGEALKEFQRYIMKDCVTWTVISMTRLKR